VGGNTPTKSLSSVFLVALLCSLCALSVCSPSTFQVACAYSYPSTLADTLNLVIGNVDWDFGNSWTTNWAMILAEGGNSAFDQAITADIGRGDYVDALYVARLAELNGYSSETISNATKTALETMLMCGSLPITANAHAYGDPDLFNAGCYMVYHRFALWGYEYAKSLDLTSKWNVTQAFSDFAEAYDKRQNSVSGEMLWCDPQEDWARSYSSRYYDEHAQTLSVFLKFAEQGVPGALAYADSAWSGIQAHWNSQYGYYGYAGTSVVECKMGGFAQIIAEYEAKKNGTIPYQDRVIQDLDYKLLANGWNSSGWSSPGVIVHATTNPQRRLWETMDAAIALQELFPDFNQSMKDSWRNMLMGSSLAWKGLMNSDLNHDGYFSGVSGVEPSNDATACAAATLFLYGIVPVTGSLAIPSREEFYNDLRTQFAASDFMFDYDNRKIRIPVNAGEITFLYGSVPVSYIFSENGVYEVEFTSDWNKVKSVNGEYVTLTPAEPQKLEAQEGNASINLSWSPPLFNGGSVIVNYKIYKGNASGTEVFFKEVENVLSYIDTEVTYGETCYYQITAINLFGESDSSNETSAALSQPVTTDDYDALWHTSNFSINLESTDPSGISEIFYRINSGSVLSVNMNGQPLITSEGSENTLEYWSVDNVGNEELPHVMLTHVKLDNSAPTGSIQINEGARFTTSTSVKLTLTAVDSISGVYEVRFSNDGAWDTERWETPSHSRVWSLTSGDGIQTVYYQIRDKAGLFSPTFSDTVTLDTIAPQGSILINEGVTHTNSTTVNLDLSSTDVSGVSQMCFSDDNLTWSPWEEYAASRSWNLQNKDGAKSVFVEYRDNAGLVSSYYSSIILDMTAPAANAGQNQTAIVGSPVSFNASDSKDNSGIISYLWTFGDGSTGKGVTTSHNYSLPGTYLVELTVQDMAGNNARVAVIVVIQTPIPWLCLFTVALGIAFIIGVTVVMVKKKPLKCRTKLIRLASLTR
jgi:fibronectin type 3 domain-containing protein